MDESGQPYGSLFTIAVHAVKGDGVSVATVAGKQRFIVSWFGGGVGGTPLGFMTNQVDIDGSISVVGPLADWPDSYSYVQGNIPGLACAPSGSHCFLSAWTTAHDIFGLFAFPR